MTMLISELRGVAGNVPDVYRAFGIEPADYKMAVLKTASNFQYFAPLTSRVIRVDTRGPGQSDILTLPWQRIPRPIYPLDPVDGLARRARRDRGAAHAEKERRVIDPPYAIRRRRCSHMRSGFHRPIPAPAASRGGASSRWQHRSTRGAMAQQISRAAGCGSRSCADITNFDPQQFSTVNFPLIKNLYDSLIEYTPDGKAVPSLATAWKIAPDNTSVTLTLRKDVKFHSGAPFNAEAVAATLKKAADPQKGKNVYATMSFVKDWTVVDPIHDHG